MSNPVLNERTLEKWAAPEASERARVSANLSAHFRC